VGATGGRSLRCCCAAAFPPAGFPAPLFSSQRLCALRLRCVPAARPAPCLCSHPPAAVQANSPSPSLSEKVTVRGKGRGEELVIVFVQQQLRRRRSSQTQVQRCKTVLKTRVERRLTFDVMLCLDLKLLAQNRTGPVSKLGTEFRRRAIVLYRCQSACSCLPLTLRFFFLHVKNLPSKFFHSKIRSQKTPFSDNPLGKHTSAYCN